MATGLTVKMRIWGGFTLVLAFLLAVAGLGLNALSSVTRGMANYDRVTENTLLIQQIDRDVTHVRRNMVLYTSENDAAALQRIRDLQAKLRPSLQKAATSIQDPGSKALVVAMQQMFEQYSSDLDKAV